MDLIAAAVFAGYGEHMGGDHVGAWGWMWVFGSVVVLAVVAGAVAAVVLAVRGGGSARRSAGAREILAERYARGEISTEEYHERLEGMR